MNRRLAQVLFPAAMLLAAAGATAQTGMRGSVIGSGGGFARNAVMTVGVTVGQAVIGRTGGGGGSVSQGFWRPAAPSAISTVTGPATGGAVPGPELRAIPNPCSGSTEFRIDGLKPGAVSLSLYDALGRRVALVAETTGEGGEISFPFDAERLSSGQYTAVLLNEGIYRVERVRIAK